MLSKVRTLKSALGRLWFKCNADLTVGLSEEEGAIEEKLEIYT